MAQHRNPPLSAANIATIEKLLARGLSDRKATAAALALGLAVSRATVIRIRTGHYLEPRESTARLAAGETTHPPQRCPACGATVTVTPCRTCRTNDYIAALRDFEKRAADLADRQIITHPRADRRRPAPR